MTFDDTPAGADTRAHAHFARLHTLLVSRRRQAAEHYAAIAALFDSGTFATIDAIGIQGGWHCWEVEAGGATMTAWLARRVGPQGRVLATNTDVLALGRPNARHVELRRHDIARDPAPFERFHLVHARMVLGELPHRDLVLHRLIEAVRPGGWLIVEETDAALQPLASPEQLGETHALANTVRTAMHGSLSARDIDLCYGRTLPRRLRARGLRDVGARAAFPIATGPSAALEAAAIARYRADLLAGSSISLTDIERLLTALARDEIDIAATPLVTTWGIRRSDLSKH